MVRAVHDARTLVLADAPLKHVGLALGDEGCTGRGRWPWCAPLGHRYCCERRARTSNQPKPMWVSQAEVLQATVCGARVVPC